MMKLMVAVLALIHFNAFAGERIGSWEVIIDGSDYQIAKTTNSDGAVSGVMCFQSSNSCVAYFVTSTNCEENSKYPILVNSSIGAMTTAATCIKLGDGKFLVLDDFDNVIKAFEGGGEIGFALPLDGGKFRVSRFDCSGATAAIRKARVIQQKPQATKNPASQIL